MCALARLARCMHEHATTSEEFLGSNGAVKEPPDSKKTFHRNLCTVVVCVYMQIAMWSRLAAT